MVRSSALKRRKSYKDRNENRFFLYVIFYHLFTGIAEIFKRD